VTPDHRHELAALAVAARFGFGLRPVVVPGHAQHRPRRAGRVGHALVRLHADDSTLPTLSARAGRSSAAAAAGRAAAARAGRSSAAAAPRVAARSRVACRAAAPAAGSSAARAARRPAAAASAAGPAGRAARATAACRSGRAAARATRRARAARRRGPAAAGRATATAARFTAGRIAAAPARRAAARSRRRRRDLAAASERERERRDAAQRRAPRAPNAPPAPKHLRHAYRHTPIAMEFQQAGITSRGNRRVSISGHEDAIHAGRATRVDCRRRRAGRVQLRRRLEDRRGGAEPVRRRGRVRHAGAVRQRAALRRDTRMHARARCRHLPGGIQRDVELRGHRDARLPGRLFGLLFVPGTPDRLRDVRRLHLRGAALFAGDLPRCDARPRVLRRALTAVRYRQEMPAGGSTQ